MLLKVRHFERIVGANGPDQPIRCSGRLEAGAFVLAIGQSEYRLRTQSSGSDDLGEFVLLEPSRTELAAGFVLTVEQDFSGVEFGDGPGCSISLVKAGDRQFLEQQLVASGIRPDSVNLIVPPDAIVSLCFNEFGQVEAWGKMSTVPPERHTPRIQ